MLQHLEEEIRLHLAYLYPLAETVISDPTIWVLGIWQPTILNILKRID